MNTETRNCQADIPDIHIIDIADAGSAARNPLAYGQRFAARATGDSSKGARSTWIKAVDFLHPAQRCSGLPCESSRSSSFPKLTVVLSTAIGCFTTCGYGGAKCED